jgi:hypothetical protein
MFRMAFLVLMVFWTAAACADSCKTIIDATRRLECYDNGFGVGHLISDILNSHQAMAAIVASLLALISGVGGPLVALMVGKRQAAASRPQPIPGITPDNRHEEIDWVRPVGNKVW